MKAKELSIHKVAFNDNQVSIKLDTYVSSVVLVTICLSSLVCYLTWCQVTEHQTIVTDPEPEVSVNPDLEIGISSNTVPDPEISCVDPDLKITITSDTVPDPEVSCVDPDLKQ